MGFDLLGTGPGTCMPYRPERHVSEHPYVHVNTRDNHLLDSWSTPRGERVYAEIKVVV